MRPGRLAQGVSWTLVAIAGVACGGSTVTSGSGGAGSGGTSGASGSSATGGSGGTKPASGPCAGSTTRAGCNQCCDAKNPGGNDRLLGVLATCLCQADVCRSACVTSVCTNPPSAFDNACSTCEAQVAKDPSSCVGAVSGQCNADAKCQAYTACIADAKCLSKP